MEDSREKIEKILNLLWDQLEQGLLYLKCAKSLRHAFQKSASVRSSHFLTLAYQSSLFTAVFAFTRMTEQRKHNDSVTLYRLLNYAENKPELLSITEAAEIKMSAQEYRKRLQQHQEFIDNAIAHRDKTLAHLDKEILNTQGTVLPNVGPIDFIQLEQCFHTIFEILDCYLKYYGMSRELEIKFREQAIEGDVTLLVKVVDEHTRIADWIRHPGH